MDLKRSTNCVGVKVVDSERPGSLTIFLTRTYVNNDLTSNDTIICFINPSFTIVYTK